MANCHNLFQAFNGNLSITLSKKQKLMTSRDDLRDRIRNHFKENHKEYKPKFRGQGSYSLGTMIRTKEDTCDLDNGVYFFPKPKESGTTLQGWVWDAVKDASSEKPQHKKKCVRVIYKGDYHIDLPVYYKVNDTNDSENPHLAVKDSDWLKSDPKEFADWFKNKRDKDGQLVRIVRHLKAWCDNRSKKMPKGIAMTVLASDCIKYNERDDQSLRDTLKQIETKLKAHWSCVMPTTPGDDLLADYDGDRTFFFESLATFIKDADKAIDTEKNQLKASKLWQKHLDTYFPDGADEDVDAKEAALRMMSTSILGGAAKLNSTGKIQESSGVPHIKHHNFGGKV